MLLKVGAFLYLVGDRNGQQHGAEVSWLKQAGFMNITIQKKGRGLIYFGGQRPAQNF